VRAGDSIIAETLFAASGQMNGGTDSRSMRRNRGCTKIKKASNPFLYAAQFRAGQRSTKQLAIVGRIESNQAEIER